MKQWELSYHAPAAEWIEAIPLGNGELGAMVFGGIQQQKVSLNLDTLWSGTGSEKGNPHKTPDWDFIRKKVFEGEYGQAETEIKDHVLGDWTDSYLPAGDLLFTFSEQNISAQAYHRKLSLNEAVYYQEYKNQDTWYRTQMFTSMQDGILAIRFCKKGTQKISVCIRLTSPIRHHCYQRKEDCELGILGQAPVYVAPNYYSCENPIVYEDGKGIQYALVLHADCKGGTLTKKEDCILIDQAEEVVVYLAGNTNFSKLQKDTFTENENWLQELDITLAKATEKSFDTLEERHKKIYQSYFECVEFALESDIAADREKLSTDLRIQYHQQDQKDFNLLALMFHYGRYLLISSSKPGTQCANLQGIWNDKVRAPWSGNYTVNINTQMNYWMAESCNLSAFHEPFFDLMERAAKRGEKTAKDLYGVQGWVTHHNIDLWGHSTPVGYYANSSDACVYAMWNMSSGWMCHHLWEHYRYTQDQKFLRERAYPLIRGAVKFYLGILTPYQKYLVTNPSTSPENMFLDEHNQRHSVSYASTMDIAVLKELFSCYLKICDILQVDEEIDAVKTALDQLPPYQIGKYGQLQEWIFDFEEADVNHRHISHLYGLYPGESITEDRLKKACETVLLRRGDEGTGWCIAWKACLWARLKNAEKAAALLNHQLRFTKESQIRVKGGGTYPNLFCAHPPFQIDGNFGFSAAIAEMLLQSHHDTVELLPAIPKEWKCGYVKGLKARGGFTIDFVWKNHTITQLHIESKHQNKISILFNGEIRQFDFYKENFCHWSAIE